MLHPLKPLCAEYLLTPFYGTIMTGSVQSLLDSAIPHKVPAPDTVTGRAGPPGPVFDSADYGTKVFTGEVADKVRAARTALRRKALFRERWCQGGRNL